MFPSNQCISKKKKNLQLKILKNLIQNKNLGMNFLSGAIGKAYTYHDFIFSQSNICIYIVCIVLLCGALKAPVAWGSYLKTGGMAGMTAWPGHFPCPSFCEGEKFRLQSSRNHIVRLQSVMHFENATPDEVQQQKRLKHIGYD